MAKRYDKVELFNVKKNDNGFLTYEFIAAQTGVFPYFDYETGEIVYELKHPDDLLKPEVVEQLNNLPITDEHPIELVTPDNAREYVKGWTHNEAKSVDNKLANKGTVFDSSLIANIVTGNKKECSLGFVCDIVEESGIYNGQKYDRRQTNFRFNHLAMVPKGRCGPECSAKLDSKEDFAAQIRYDQVDYFKNKKRKDGKDMAVIKLDGVEYEVDEKVKARLDELEKKNEDLTKKVGQLEGKLDGKEDEIKKLKKDNEKLKNNQLSTEKLDEAIEKRLELIEDAKTILGDEYDFKGKSERDIKIDCIKTVNEKFDGTSKSDEYINARFDTIIDFMKLETSSVGDNNLRFMKKDGANDEIEKMRVARLNMRK